MRERVAFDSLTGTSDGRGGVASEWVEQFTSHAEFRYERGKEAIEAGGLTGTATFKVKVRASSSTRAVTPEWRMRDVRRGIAYNVREVDAITDRLWVWIVAERGVAI